METHVLVVDDDPTVNKSIVNFLDDYEYSTQSAFTAEEALYIAQTETFDVGIIDLRLPNMDGDQLILELHKVQPNLKFLIHTGSTEFILTDELKALGIEFEHVLNKPLPDMNVMVDFIERLSN